MADTGLTPAADEIANRNWLAFRRDYDAGHGKYVDFAKKCDDAIGNELWDDTVRKELEASGRPALTFNQILPVINAIRGHYSSQQVDFRVTAKSGGATPEVADIFSRLIDDVLDRNLYHTIIEPTIFFDGLVEERGYVDARVEFDDNILGEIKLRATDPRSVVLDASANEYDPNTWKRVTIDRWLSLDDVELYYGKDARTKVVSLASMSGAELSSEAYDVETFGDPNRSFIFGQNELDEGKIKNVRVIESQYRVVERIREFVDPASGRTRPVPAGWDEAHVKAVCQKYELLTRKRFGARIRWTVSTDRVMLHDGPSPYEDYTLIPYFPVFRRGRPRGLVRYLLDAQEYLNKAESQTLHIINTTANSGWIVEAGSLVGMTTEDLESKGASTGLVVVYGRGRAKPEKIQANSIPTGIENFANRAHDYIQSTTGAGALMGDMPSPEVAGVTLRTARASALVTIQPFFDNLKITRALLARKLIRLIKGFYTEPRVYTVTDWRDPMMTQEEIAINIEAAGEIVNNVMVGDYDVVVGTVPARDSFEDTQFAEALQLREAGVPIPAYHVVLASHLVGKHKIAEEVRQIEGLGDLTPEQQMMQQLQMQSMQLQVAEMEARIENLRATAGLTAAKADAAMTESQRLVAETIHQREMDLKEFKAKILQFAANLQNKLDLANLHTGAKMSGMRYTQLMGSMQKEEDRNAQLERDTTNNEYKLLLERTRGDNQRRAAAITAGKRNALAGRNRAASGRGR